MGSKSKNLMTSVLIEDTGYLTERRRQCDHGGRNWSYAVRSQGMPGGSDTATSQGTPGATTRS